MVLGCAGVLFVMVMVLEVTNVGDAQVAVLVITQVIASPLARVVVV